MSSTKCVDYTGNYMLTPSNAEANTYVLEHLLDNWEMHCLHLIDTCG